jgi:hypothetical protein
LASSEGSGSGGQDKHLFMPEKRPQTDLYARCTAAFTNDSTRACFLFELAESSLDRQWGKSLRECGVIIPQNAP